MQRCGLWEVEDEEEEEDEVLYGIPRRGGRCWDAIGYATLIGGGRGEGLHWMVGPWSWGR